MEPFRAGLGNGEERKEGREKKEGKGVGDRKEGMRKKRKGRGLEQRRELCILISCQCFGLECLFLRSLDHLAPCFNSQ